MCPFRKVEDGGDRSWLGYATRGCICEVNKQHLKWMPKTIFNK